MLYSATVGVHEKTDSVNGPAAHLRIAIWTVPGSRSAAAFIRSLASRGFQLSVVLDAGHGPRMSMKHWSRRFTREGIGLFARACTWPMRAFARSLSDDHLDLGRLCAECGVPVITLGNMNEAAAREKLSALPPDIVIMAGTRILSDETLRIPRLVILNFHTGILPEYRGSDTIFWAVVHGGPIGFTFHEPTGKLDQGRIYYEETIVERASSDPEELYRRCVERASLRLPSILSGIASGTLLPQPAKAGGTVYRSPTPSERHRLLRKQEAAISGQGRAWSAQIRRGVRAAMQGARTTGLLRVLQSRSSCARILLYHRVRDATDEFVPPELGLFVTPDRFDRQLSYLARYFRVLSLHDLFADLAAGRGGALSITFDDGFGDNARIAAPILERHGLRATFFLATDGIGNRRYLWLHRWFFWKVRAGDRANDLVIKSTRGRWRDAGSLERDLRGRIFGSAREEILDELIRSSGFVLPAPDSARLYLDEEEVRRLADAGHEIGSHGTSHSSFGALPADEARRELEESWEKIKEWTGHAPRYFSYPYGRAADSIPGWEIVLRDMGYQGCLLAVPRLARPHDLPWKTPRVDIFDEDPLQFSWAVEGFPTYRWIRPWRRQG